jgi:hypothetical protein
MVILINLQSGLKYAEHFSKKSSREIGLRLRMSKKLPVSEKFKKYADYNIDFKIS